MSSSASRNWHRVFFTKGISDSRTWVIHRRNVPARENIYSVFVTEESDTREGQRDDGARQGGVHLPQLPSGGRVVRALPEAARIELRGVAWLRRLPGQVRSRHRFYRDLLQMFNRDFDAGRETEAPGDRTSGGHSRRRNDLQTETRDILRVSHVRRHSLSTGDRRLRSHILQELRGVGEELSRVWDQDCYCEWNECAGAETRGEMVAARGGGQSS